jgi:hypothetical protein
VRSPREGDDERRFLAERLRELLDVCMSERREPYRQTRAQTRSNVRSEAWNCCNSSVAVSFCREEVIVEALCAALLTSAGGTYAWGNEGQLQRVERNQH